MILYINDISVDMFSWTPGGFAFKELIEHH